MMELEYRETINDSECSWGPWKLLPIERGITLWATHEDYEVQIRVKPEFVPGWWVYVGDDASDHESASWFDHEFPAWNNGTWQRVNVVITPAE